MALRAQRQSALLIVLYLDAPACQIFANQRKGLRKVQFARALTEPKIYDYFDRYIKLFQVLFAVQ